MENTIIALRNWKSLAISLFGGNEMDPADGIFMGCDDPWETLRAINDSVERMMHGNETAIGKGVGSMHIS
ncbi:hypothetical protein NPIL_160851 [Nephila pilipes]|uniref:Uncharacterized protein n=1 Tax=Nephila pilipes TaxID=299642 RepID=A0A8X6ND61_NEPPI|nr:hypothetical protein NPIL_160851 [Nephila pilipes]